MLEITNLVNDRVPCESGIIDYNVYLSVAKLSSLLHQAINVVLIRDISDNGDGSFGAASIEVVYYIVRLLCTYVISLVTWKGKEKRRRKSNELPNFRFAM